MTMTAGSVTVNADGTRTGSGIALTIYDAMVPAMESLIPPWAAALATNEDKVQGRKAIAAQAGAIAAGIVAGVQTATITVPANTWDPGSPSVQRTLNSAIT
jgi:xanthine dehydrogenase molybdopterin-binding subunit B